jgi:CHAT domain-containing protein/tetratricopeptide (TPR) repeat protein
MMRRTSAFVYLLFFTCVFGSLAFCETWNELISTSDSLAKAFLYDSALSIAKSALAQMETEYDTMDTTLGNIYYKIATYHTHLGDYASAELMFSRARGIFEFNYGLRHAKVGKCLNALGLVCRYQGKYEEAESFLALSLEIKESSLGLNHVDVANSLSNLAELYLEQSKYSRAEPLMRRSLQIRQQELGTADPLVARSMDDLGKLYVELSRFMDAMKLFKQALAILEENFEGDHPYIALVLTDLAGLYDELGQYDDAEPLYKRALSIWERLDDPNIPVGLCNLGLNYYHKGDYLRAESFFLEALKRMQEFFGEGHPNIPPTLNLLANLYISVGKYQDAERLLTRALEISKGILGLVHPEIANHFNNLAYCLIYQKRYSEAAALLDTSINILEASTGMNNPSVANVLETLAQLHLREDDYVTAESLLERSIEIFHGLYGERHPLAADAKISLADIYCKLGEYKKADLLYEQAATTLSATMGQKHPKMAECLEHSSYCQRLQNNRDIALKNADRAFEIRKDNFYDFSPILTEQDALTFSGQLHQCVDGYLSCLLDYKNDPDLNQRAANIVLASKGVVSDAILRRQQVLVSERDSSIQTLADSYKMTRLAISKQYLYMLNEEKSEASLIKLDSLEERADELEEELSRLSSSFQQRLIYDRINTEYIKDLLPDKSLLIEYCKYDYLPLNEDKRIQHYAVVTVDPSGIVSYNDLGPAVGIDSLVEVYRRHILKVTSPGYIMNNKDLEEFRTVSSELYKKTWMPIEKYIGEGYLVFIAPDGGLNLISFAGLINGDDHYLIEGNPIHYLSTGRDLARLGETKNCRRGLMAMGDPDFDYTASAGNKNSGGVIAGASDSKNAGAYNLRSGRNIFNNLQATPLPGTRVEVEKIADSWQNNRSEPIEIYLGPDASEENFKGTAPKNRVIHLATHGFFVESECDPAFNDEWPFLRKQPVGENPLLLSGLLLAGANKYKEKLDNQTAEDGILTAYEVAGMDFNGTDLVVLSACETGLGQVREGEGVFGLRRAFLMAGSKTVICALWSVSDQVTAELMNFLYGNENADLPTLIRKYSMDKIAYSRKIGRPDHPYLWAPFIAIGDWHSL